MRCKNKLVGSTAVRDFICCTALPVETQRTRTTPKPTATLSNWQLHSVHSPRPFSWTASHFGIHILGSWIKWITTWQCGTTRQNNSSDPCRLAAWALGLDTAILFPNNNEPKPPIYNLGFAVYFTTEAEAEMTQVFWNKLKLKRKYQFIRAWTKIIVLPASKHTTINTKH